MFPKSMSGGGGSVPIGDESKALALSLSAPEEMNVGEIALVPFTDVAYNTGVTYNQGTKEIVASKQGNVVFTASVGVMNAPAGMGLTVFIFKNGVPFRQGSSSNAVEDAPFCIAEAAVTDLAEEGDIYSLYVTAKDAGSMTYELSNEPSVTRFETVFL